MRGPPAAPRAGSARGQLGAESRRSRLDAGPDAVSGRREGLRSRRAGQRGLPGPRCTAGACPGAGAPPGLPGAVVRSRRPPVRRRDRALRASPERPEPVPRAGPSLQRLPVPQRPSGPVPEGGGGWGGGGGGSALPPQAPRELRPRSAVPRGRTGSPSPVRPGCGMLGAGEGLQPPPLGSPSCGAGEQGGLRTGNPAGPPVAGAPRVPLGGADPALPVLERHRAGPGLGGARSPRGFPGPPTSGPAVQGHPPAALAPSPRSGRARSGQGRSAPHRASLRSCSRSCGCRSGCDPCAWLPQSSTC